MWKWSPGSLQAHVVIEKPVKYETKPKLVKTTHSHESLVITKNDNACVCLLVLTWSQYFQVVPTTCTLEMNQNPLLNSV